MDHIQNHHNMNLVLSTDAKPRLKWTPELHQRFVDAVAQLGGADKATPKSLMRVMAIPGLTLYHLKSHLQKFRLGKSQQLDTSTDSNKEDIRDYKEVQSTEEERDEETKDQPESNNQINESLQIAQALQLQMEVQKKLHEQIEVQRHLQLRIEAQGKYLQSVLKKAQETLSGYTTSSVGIEMARAELSQLVSMIKSGCTTPSISELTEMGSSGTDDQVIKQLRGMCSVESSITSSESSDRKEEKDKGIVNDSEKTHKCSSTSVELSLMNVYHEDEHCNVGSSNQAAGRKRNSSVISKEIFAGQPSVNKATSYMEKNCFKTRKLASSAMLDLNSQFQNDVDLSPKAIDLNCQETEHSNDHFECPDALHLTGFN